MVRVDIVQPDRSIADANLAGAGFAGSKDAVLNESAVKSLFGKVAVAGVLGQQIRIGTTTVTVVGVVSNPAIGGGNFGGAGGGTDQASGIVYLPLEPFLAMTSQKYVSQVNLRAADPGSVETVRLAVRDLLAQRHGVQDIQVISLAREIGRAHV